MIREFLKAQLREAVESFFDEHPRLDRARVEVARALWPWVWEERDNIQERLDAMWAERDRLHAQLNPVGEKWHERAAREGRERANRLWRELGPLAPSDFPERAAFAKWVTDASENPQVVTCLRDAMQAGADREWARLVAERDSRFVVVTPDDIGRRIRCKGATLTIEKVEMARWFHAGCDRRSEGWPLRLPPHDWSWEEERDAEKPLRDPE